MIRTLVVTTLGLSLAATAAAAPCGSENLLARKMPHSVTGARGDLTLLTDGKVSHEGAQWNAPVAITLDTPSSTVTFDLGEARPVAALFMQGDANDSYPVSGSVDGAPESFRPLGEFPNIVNVKGHGLRTRTLEIAPATVRYLRISGAQGDGFFSISEVGAYCQKPSPFPPDLTPVVAPPQFAGDDAPKEGWKSFGLLYGFALIAFGLLVQRTLRRT